MKITYPDQVETIKQRSSVQDIVLRKVIHLSAIFVPVLYFFLDKSIVLILISTGFVVAIVVEWLRHINLSFRLKFEQILGPLLKDFERSRITGATYLILGALISVYFFPKKIAIFCLLVVIIPDAIAALVGCYVGKHLLFASKTWEGSFAFFSTTFFIAFILLAYPLWLLLIASVLITMMELFWIYSLDNLVLPIFCGIIIEVLVYFI